MKNKKFKQKLVLNKKTIADLAIGELGNVKGGKPTPATRPTLFCRSCAIDMFTNCI